MNEQAGNSENDFLWKVLANPADPGHSHVRSLQLLVNEFPQSGVIRALLVPKGDDQHLKHASAHFTPDTLYKMVNDMGSLPLVSASQIVYSEEPSGVARNYAETATQPLERSEEINYFHVAADQDIAYLDDDEQEEDTITDAVYDEQQDIADIVPEKEYEAIEVMDDAEEEADDEHHQYDGYEATDDDNHKFSSAENEITDAVIVDDEPAVSTSSLPAEEEKEEITATAPAEQAKPYEEYLAEVNEETAAEQAEPFDDKVRYFHQDIDDEIYDEIVSIEDISLEQLAAYNKEIVNQEQEAKDDIAETGTNTDVAQGNYFVFEPASAESREEHAESESPAIIAREQTAPREASTPNISRYNDEKMPYTFMWWLDKTRKEHADIYQPYVSNNTPVVARNAQGSGPDELQQQYYESIFNINSVNELDRSTAQQQSAVNHAERKEDKIIERFIQEEPQIKHPSMVKLDSENKAKKSSEDRDELVTETLAKIYTEQMLYHKALLTYKKLMLKFPEKSLYFAGQIELLENKIN